MKTPLFKIAMSAVTLGIIGAIVTAILYWMGLPIFDEIDLSWLFVAGLVSAAVAGAGLALQDIWGID